MRWSFKIGQVSGIDIKIHLTFIFIIIWAAARGASDMGGIGGALYAAVSILLLFVCITLHELGHSLVAGRLGIRVKDITLLPIGGLARLEKMPQKPLHELLIALAGPAVNFTFVVGLGVVLALIGRAGGLPNPRYLLYMLDRPRSLLSLLVYLLAANLILGLFNLIPAFPMDGGRVLRALLAMWTSYPRATRIAARVGQLIALGLVLLGLSSVGSFMLVLVALFVFTGASFEDQAVQARSMLNGLSVRHALPTQRLRPVAAEDSLAHVVELGLNTRQRDFPVLRDGALVGIVSRDDASAAIQSGQGLARVEEVMRREFPKVSPDSPLLEGQALIAQTGLSVLPVFDRDHFLGLISLEDINRAYANLSWRRR